MTKGARQIDQIITLSHAIVAPANQRSDIFTHRTKPIIACVESCSRTGAIALAAPAHNANVTQGERAAPMDFSACCSRRVGPGCVLAPGAYATAASSVACVV